MSSAPQHILTTHDHDSRPVFHALTTQPSSSTNPLIPPTQTVNFIYANPSLPPNLTLTSDLAATQHVFHHGADFGPNRIAPENGVSASLVTTQPGGSSPIHRTKTLDLAVVVDGEVELLLDSGEARRLRKGDTVVQRGTMHKWTNVTPMEVNGGVSIMFFVVLDAREIVLGDGTVLEPEFHVDQKTD